MTVPTLSTRMQGKTYLVTGSSSGIGRAIAIELAGRGARVLLHGRRPSERMTAVQAEVESRGSGVATLFCDFTKTDSLSEFVESAWSVHDGIDGWINNAGGDVLTGDWPSRSMEEKLHYLWQVDVAATLYLSRAIGNRMIQRFVETKSSVSGAFNIINMGWDQATQGMAGDSGELFATTKGAIMAMSRSLAQSLAPAVRVNCLAPGWIQTQWGEQANTYWSERASRESLMNRWGNPTDVALVAAFLCSDEARFISGQTFPVNGGFKFA